MTLGCGTTRLKAELGAVEEAIMHMTFNQQTRGLQVFPLLMQHLLSCGRLSLLPLGVLQNMHTVAAPFPCVFTCACVTGAAGCTLKRLNACAF